MLGTTVIVLLSFLTLSKSRNPPNLILRVIPKTIFIPRDEGDNDVRLHYQEIGSPGKYGEVKIVIDGEDKPPYVINHFGTVH